MKRKKRFTSEKPALSPAAPPKQPAHDKVRAVAFKIEDRVYEGATGASHISLYSALLLQQRVPAHTLDAWTSDERNHGFVTEKGEFLDRAEVFRRYGAALSQDLRGKGMLKNAP